MVIQLWTNDGDELLNDIKTPSKTTLKLNSINDEKEVNQFLSKILSMINDAHAVGYK